MKCNLSQSSQNLKKALFGELWRLYYKDATLVHTCLRPLQLAKYKPALFEEPIESMLSTITCANLPVFVTGVSGCVISCQPQAGKVGERRNSRESLHADQAQL
jgi:hypothetical protein